MCASPCFDRVRPNAGAKYTLMPSRFSNLDHVTAFACDCVRPRMARARCPLPATLALFA